jgi:UDP-glucuronate 4-epimerase
MSVRTYLVTGSAGFIGFHLSRRLLEKGVLVVGADDFNDYYEVSLKEDRNAILSKYSNFKLYRGDLSDLAFIKKIFSENKFDKICHLAAQAGVRYSLTNPHAYIKANLVAFTNVLDEAKNALVKDFVYASSSSVYGANEKVPFSVDDPVDKPISLYAATKKANELMAYTYHHLFGMNTTGLRFFTVYGPYGRPDMALFSFTKKIMSGEPIEIFNYGKMKRDFTYIDDIIDGVERALEKSEPCEVFNLGNHRPVDLSYFVSTLEKSLGKAAKKELKPMQPGDVPETYADIDHTRNKLGWEPKVAIEEGVKRFVEWYREYYRI